MGSLATKENGAVCCFVLQLALPYVQNQQRREMDCTHKACNLTLSSLVQASASLLYTIKVFYAGDS
jgi:hypothetical protein